jgi:transglutaminase-like putative cysteine protease
VPRFAISSGRFGCGDAGRLTDPSSVGAIRRVVCHLDFEVGSDVALALQIAPASSAGDLLEERLDVTIDGRETRLPVTELATDRAGRVHVLQGGAAGVLAISYAATIRPLAIPAAPVATDDVVVDAEAIAALRQSRYCPSDAMTGFAAVELAESRGPDMAHAAASWVFERLAYQPGWSGPFDTAVDTLLAGAGTCRDFAHLTISLCRALGVPARFVAVYAPGISPMDFHAVVEARRGNGWEVLDPTRLAPRSSLVRIATGRDAADTAFATTLRGQAELTSYEISTVLDGDLPPDDHRTVTTLA